MGKGKNSEKLELVEFEKNSVFLVPTTPISLRKTRARTAKLKKPDGDEVKKKEVKRKPAYKNADRATYLRDEVTGEKYYQCPICFKKLKGHLTIHMRTHNNNKPWPCDICGKQFSQKCNLQTHLLTHEKDKRDADAPIAGTSSKDLSQTQGELGGNVKSASSPEKSAKITPGKNSQVKTSSKKKSKSSFPCSKCELSFETPEKLSTHVECVHMYRRGEEHVCVFCNKVFKRKEYFDIHIKRHIGEEDEVKHKCPKCKRTFFNKINFDSHVQKNKCKKKRLYKYINECAECKKVFETKRGLLRHFFNNHVEMKDRQFKCPKCPMAFNIHCYLEQHMVKHTGEKPYECSVCGDKFKHQSSVKNHLKYVHDVQSMAEFEKMVEEMSEMASSLISEDLD